MADDTTIIEGTVKFRDGKKWKSRWCVMRKLSPVADCVHVQLYRDSKARWAAAPTKASLSLQHFLGIETGFTLDKHSHTLALICKDFVAVLAFETHERLIQWQVKVCGAVGSWRSYVVVVCGGGPLSAGPARLLLRAGCLALTAGSPPRLLGLWPLHHLRRYGVVDGRFCFEGGSLCGKGQGLHALLSEQAQHIARDVDSAAHGRLQHRDLESPRSRRAFRPDTLPAELSRRPPSPGWPSAERPPPGELGLGDAASVGSPAGRRPAAAGPLPRCRSCMSTLGALSRSSTAALTPGAAHFSPAWTMDALREAADRQPPADLGGDDDGGDGDRRLDGLESDGVRACGCGLDGRPSPVGPYENYDVPRLPSAEVEGEYYDTPRRLKERLDDGPFAITRSATTSSLCGCPPAAARRPRGPTVVDVDDSGRDAGCACRRVTAWIGLPSWRRAPDALYATVDVGRKARRRARPPPAAAYENVTFAAAPPAGCAAAADYLVMSPAGGYAPMSLSPAGAPRGRSASNPALCAASARGPRRRRSCSAESSRPLEDVKEAEGAGSASSTETLRGGRAAEGAAGAGGAGGGRAAGGARDSSSSNDSGVSSWCRRRGGARCRRSRSVCGPRAAGRPAQADGHKSSSAEAEVPVHGAKPLRGVMDTHSTSSGTSDMSDYIETLSICSSHSSSDTPVTMRVMTSSLRPRSGKEYHSGPRLSAAEAPPARCPQP